MDKFWSICAMPIGLTLCFGPALLVWIVAELKSPPPGQSEKEKKS